MKKISECAMSDEIFIAPPGFIEDHSIAATTAITTTAGTIANPTTTTAAAAAAITTTTTTGAAAVLYNIIKQQNCSIGHQIPSDILDDLASRFIINVPDDERNNLIRICFQIELAHWFYLDFFCSIEEKKLIPCGIKQFATHLFHHIPFLRTHLSGIDKILENWKEYKLSVPTYGAILMSEDLKHVLLVQSYWAKSSWGFPKGKVNEHEDPIHCATREVFEETGYDITGLIVPNDYIEAVINYQYTRLYLVRNVPLQTLFSPRTRKEIKCCEWFPVDSLPTNKNDVISKANLGINANSFFMIMPFIKRLKKWVYDNRSGIDVSNPSSSCSTIPLSASKAISGRKGDTKQQQIYGTFAVNIHSTSYKANFSSNGKRQRHKSMGDIDGIKINVTSNNSCISSCSVAKILPSIRANSGNTNQYFNQNEINNENQIPKREKFVKNNSKRQLFNTSSSSMTSCGSVNSSLTSTLSSCNFDIKSKRNLDSSSSCVSSILNLSGGSNCSNSNSSGGSIGRNRPQKVGNVKCKSKSVANLKINQSSSASAPKMNPNLDSWTSFTFTKNFIANVFC